MSKKSRCCIIVVLAGRRRPRNKGAMTFCIRPKRRECAYFFIMLEKMQYSVISVRREYDLDHPETTSTKLLLHIHI